MSLRLRAVAGWPLARPIRRGRVRMTNLIGSEIEDYRRWLAIPGAAVHIYGKAAASEGPRTCAQSGRRSLARRPCGPVPGRHAPGLVRRPAVDGDAGIDRPRAATAASSVWATVLERHRRFRSASVSRRACRLTALTAPCVAISIYLCFHVLLYISKCIYPSFSSRNTEGMEEKNGCKQGTVIPARCF